MNSYDKIYRKKKIKSEKKNEFRYFRVSSEIKNTSHLFCFISNVFLTFTFAFIHAISFFIYPDYFILFGNLNFILSQWGNIFLFCDCTKSQLRHGDNSNKNGMSRSSRKSGKLSPRTFQYLSQIIYSHRESTPHSYLLALDRSK